MARPNEQGDREGRVDKERRRTDDGQQRVKNVAHAPAEQLDQREQGHQVAEAERQHRREPGVRTAATSVLRRYEVNGAEPDPKDRQRAKQNEDANTGSAGARVREDERHSAQIEPRHALDLQSFYRKPAADRAEKVTPVSSASTAPDWAADARPGLRQIIRQRIEYRLQRPECQQRALLPMRRQGDAEQIEHVGRLKCREFIDRPSFDVLAQH